MKSFDGYLKLKLGNDYVLLAGGNHKALSDFSMAHDHPYLPLAGGTMTGTITGNTGNGLIVQSANTGSWKEGIRVYPASNNYSLISLQSSDSKNVFAMVTNVSSHLHYFDVSVDGVNKRIDMPYKDGTIALTSDISDYAYNKTTSDGRYLRKDANDSTAYLYEFTKTNDHAIKVGTIRGRAVGSQTGEFIHLYERVAIGSPNGWGSRNAPSYGLATYGGAWLATDTGNVGIGTTNPSYKLTVMGDIQAVNSTQEVGIRVRNINTAASSWSIIRMGNGSYDTGPVLFFNSASRTDDGGANTFTIRNDVGKVRIGNTSYATWFPGSVGIGTDSPSHKLHTIGKVLIEDNVTGGGTTNSLLNILFNGTHEYGVVMKIHSYGNDSPGIRFSHSSSAGDINSLVNTNWTVGMYSSSTEKFAITQDRGTNGWGTHRLVINSSGNIGIGTDSPGYKLTVNSAGDIVQINSTSGSYGCINYTLSGYDSWSAGITSSNLFYFWNSNQSRHLVDINRSGRVDIITAETANNSLELHSSGQESTIAFSDRSGTYTKWTVGRGTGAIGSTYGWWNSSRNCMTLTNTGLLSVIGNASTTNGIYIYQYGSYNYHPIYGDTAGRPGISISGNYPYIWLTGGGISNALHGATITLCSPDSVAGTDGSFKTWTFGVPGQGGTWMDLAYSYNYGNPHNGINGWAGFGSPSRVMRWTTALTFVYGVGNDMASTLTVTSSRNGSWVYTASFLAPNLTANYNNVIFIGKAHSTRNSFGWTHYHIGDGSTSNYCALEIWGVGNAFQMRYDKVATFLGNVNAPNYYTTSDARKKQNIHKISDNIKQFEWKETGETSYGFVAQDLEVKHPELVNDDGNMKTVNYNAALSLVVAKLENRVKELEAKLGLETPPPVFNLG